MRLASSSNEGIFMILSGQLPLNLQLQAINLILNRSKRPPCECAGQLPHRNSSTISVSTHPLARKYDRGRRENPTYVHDKGNNHFGRTAFCWNIARTGARPQPGTPCECSASHANATGPPASHHEPR